MGAYGCDTKLLGFCTGHPILSTVPGTGALGTNQRSPYASQSDSLILNIQVTTHTATKAAAWSEKESREVAITIGLDLELPASGSFGVGTAGSYKDETLNSTSKSWQVTGIKKASTIDNIGRSVNVDRYPGGTLGAIAIAIEEDLLVEFGSTFASAEFSFYDADSEETVTD